MRKMATLRQIDDIRPIHDAESIECAVVGGWTVVVKRGEFKPGDLAVYVEIDAWIPHDLAPFLSKGQEPREFEGIRGERLRTVKLRGQISQGLLLPVSVLTNYGADLSLGDDVNSHLAEHRRVIKYEPPIPAQLAGEVKGAFPGVIPKTDQERVQNLSNELAVWKQEADFWEVTEKLDGSSMTVYMIDGEFGVCSRNLDLKRNHDNSLWKAAYTQALEEILEGYVEFDGCNIALQGELVGEGIQNNLYKKKGQHFFLFDVYLINEGRYMTPDERHKFVRDTGISHVPVIDSGGLIQEQHTMDSILAGAEGKSILNDQAEREGIVFKRADGKASFKAISNRYLIKTGG